MNEKLAGKPNLGHKISDVANPFHGNRPEEAEESLTSLSPSMTIRWILRIEPNCTIDWPIFAAAMVWWKESAAYFAKGLELEPNQLFFEPWHLLPSSADPKWRPGRV